MSATIMSKDTAAATRGSSKYLAAAMLFGALYFLLDFVCPGGQVSTGGSGPTWMSLVTGILLAGAFLSYRPLTTTVPNEVGDSTPTSTSVV